MERMHEPTLFVNELLGMLSICASQWCGCYGQEDWSPTEGVITGSPPTTIEQSRVKRKQCSLPIGTMAPDSAVCQKKQKKTRDEKENNTWNDDDTRKKKSHTEICGRYKASELEETQTSIFSTCQFLQPSHLFLAGLVPPLPRRRREALPEFCAASLFHEPPILPAAYVSVRRGDRYITSMGKTRWTKTEIEIFLRKKCVQRRDLGTDTQLIVPQTEGSRLPFVVGLCYSLAQQQTI